MEISWLTPANPPKPDDYIFHNGRRHVRPYFFEFISHVNNRWAGKTIVDLFADDFKGRTYDYYVSAVKCGRIQVEGEMVAVSYRVQLSQRITHYVHRHEPPVTACDLSILHKEPDVLVVNKQPSIPVHPCGQYRKNTVVGILEAEYGLAPLFPIHRLDRLVSGLLIFARTASMANSFRKQIESGTVQKEYIARVIGCFPESEQEVNVNITHNARERRSTTDVDNCFGDAFRRKKTACTRFSRISTNGTQSIVLCKPITGRTHQIRVHLQHIGHPIANDFLYLSQSGTPVSTRSGFDEICFDESEGKSNEDFAIDPMCTNCPSLAPKGYEAQEEGLWLHSIRYSGSDWVYECPFPEWASLS